MTLKSFNLKQTSLSNNVTESLTMWLDYNFFDQGGYFSRSNETLSQVNHPVYVTNKVYGSAHKNWVWESGNVSVLVNGIPNSNNNVNYRDGLIVFNSAPVGTVTASYAYKKVNVIGAQDNKFFRTNNTAFEVYEGVFREDALQLPAVVVQNGSSSSSPSQLGSYFRHIKEEKLLAIYHENSELVERISDVLFNQVDGYFSVFDFDKTHISGVYPISSSGFLYNSVGKYPYLTANYPMYGLRNSSVYIEKTEKEDIQQLKNKIYYSTVRFRLTGEFNMGIA